MKSISKEKMPDAITKTWATTIWQNIQLIRAYLADVNVPGQKYHDGYSAEAETNISIIE